MLTRRNYAVSDIEIMQLVTSPHCLQGLSQEGHPVDNGKHIHPIKVQAMGTVQAPLCKLNGRLRGSATLNHIIFQLCFIILKMKLCVCRNLCGNFRQIGQKMKL